MACDDGPPVSPAAFRHRSRCWREDECRDHGGEEVVVVGGGERGCMSLIV